jgi:hypothetical protein
MRIYFLLLFAFFIVGCVPQPAIIVESAVLGEQTVTIAQGTQYRNGNLRIGVISVLENSAALAILVEANDPSEAQTNSVKETLAVGNETNAGGYMIKNIRTKTGIGGFRPGQSSGSVTLQITPI